VMRRLPSTDHQGIWVEAKGQPVLMFQTDGYVQRGQKGGEWMWQLERWTMMIVSEPGEQGGRESELVGRAHWRWWGPLSSLLRPWGGSDRWRGCVFRGSESEAMGGYHKYPGGREDSSCW
jgi:hypothetical protein